MCDSYVTRAGWQLKASFMGRSGHALKVQVDIDKNVLPSVLRRRAYLSKIGATGGSVLQYVAVCCSVL